MRNGFCLRIGTKLYELVRTFIILFVAHCACVGGELDEGIFFKVGKGAASSLDGTIGEGEYAASFALQYLTKNREAKKNFLASVQARTYFTWDETNLYVAVKSDAEVIRSQTRARDSSLWEDDSVEVYVANEGLTADLHQFIFNAAGSLYDAKNGAKKWDAVGVKSKSIVKDGVWQFEAAFPWTTFGIAAALGNRVRINVARTYYGGGKKRAGVGNEKWAHMGLKFGTAMTRGSWSEKESFPVMQLAAAPTWHAAEAVIPEGAKGEGVIPLQEKAADGTILFSALAHYAIPAPVHFRGVRTDPKTETLYVCTENWLSPSEKRMLHLSFRDYETDSKVLFEKDVPILAAHGRVEQAVDVKDLPPGLYRVWWEGEREGKGEGVRGAHALPKEDVGRAAAPRTPKEDVGRAAAPRTPKEDFFYYAKPKNGKAPWEGITAGLEDRVPAPWPAPDFDATSVSCWNRKMRFSKGTVGLVNSIQSGGRELLRHPVMIDFNYQTLPFTCTQREVKLSYADYVFTTTGFPITIQMRVEFDGLMWFKMRYGEKGYRMNDLKVRIPLKKTEVKAWDDCYSVYDKVHLEPNQKGTWHANVIHRPFFWVGGERGLMGGHPGLKGWHCRDKEKGESFTLKEDSATVMLHFVDTPFTMEEAREIEFYLQATPVRPRRPFQAGRSRNDILTWTGYLSNFFEAKIPGMMWDEKWKIFDSIRRSGKRVTYYFATKGASPVFPWWGWYGDDWNLSGDAAVSVLEITSGNRVRDDQSRWAWTCCNSRNYLDYKLYSLNYFINEPKYGVKDLYFDLSWPRVCSNERHGCRWKDEFGSSCFENDIKGVRELQKRAALILQRKNPGGIIRGHLTSTRTPADVFFDVLTMGEAYERRVSDKHNYYDILSPHDMEVTYGMRANETEIDFMCQIYRTISVYKPALLKDWDPLKPEFDRATRHFAAYQTIFDLNDKPYFSDRKKELQTSGPQLTKLDACKVTFGRDAQMVAYWQEENPVHVASPEERFIYGVKSGNGKVMLVLLNDTDCTLTKRLSLDLKPYFVHTWEGKDLFGNGTLSLESGTAEISLPPRESRFFVFEK